MIWLQILGAVAVVYLLIGLGIAVVRTLAIEFMPWPLFVFTWLFWPSLWFD